MSEHVQTTTPQERAGRVLIGHADPAVLDAIASCAKQAGLTPLAARHRREAQQLLPVDTMSEDDFERASLWIVSEQDEGDGGSLPVAVVLDERWLDPSRHPWARTLFDRVQRLGCCVLAIDRGASNDENPGPQIPVDGRIALPIDEVQVRTALSWTVHLSEQRARVHDFERAIAERDATIALLNRRLDRMVARDPLTGLPNRQATMDHLRKVWDETNRSTDGLSVVLCDLDEFQQLNAAHGQTAGDAVLRQVGAVLRARVRSDDFVGRIGNEEFLVVLSNMTLEGAYRRAEELRHAIATTPIRYSEKQRPVTVTASFGVSMRLEMDHTVDHLLMRAMDALSNAKAAGRDCVELLDMPRQAA